MHPSKSYRSTPEEVNLVFAERRGFGVWVISGKPEADNNAPVISTAPFYMTHSNKEDEYPIVKAHFMKDNPIVQRLRDEPDTVINCTIIVSGPDGYVSPDWYDLNDQVPTWDYVTVHLKGQLRLLPEEDLHGVLDELSGKFEKAFEEDKPMWNIDKMPTEKLNAMMRVLAPVSLQITGVDGTWKLGQAKPQASRLRVAEKMMQYSNRKQLIIGTELRALSELHRVPFTGLVSEIECMYNHAEKESCSVGSTSLLKYVHKYGIAMAIALSFIVYHVCQSISI